MNQSATGSRRPIRQVATWLAACLMLGAWMYECRGRIGTGSSVLIREIEKWMTLYRMRLDQVGWTVETMDLFETMESVARSTVYGIDPMAFYSDEVHKTVEFHRCVSELNAALDRDRLWLEQLAEARPRLHLLTPEQLSDLNKLVVLLDPYAPARPWQIVLEVGALIRTEQARR